VLYFSCRDHVQACVRCPRRANSYSRPGPFWRADAPLREMGSSTVHNIPNGDHTYIYGTVKDYLTGEPVEGAELDVW